MCVRRAAGYCCIQYQVCADQTNAFTLDGGTAISAIDTACTLDYIAIPGEAKQITNTVVKIDWHTFS